MEVFRAASETLAALIGIELEMHVKYCAGWGLDPAAMEAAPEGNACMAYTRYVLETGLRGDALDLHVALIPCVAGYGEIGVRLAADPATRREGNPYAAWVEMYSGEEYQAVARAAAAQLDRLSESRGGDARYPRLRTIFAEACRLEADFWQMGLDAAGT
ncbi:MAG: TenA family protein [Bauldia litoralis]